MQLGFEALAWVRFLLFFLLLRSFWFGIAYFVKLLFALLWVVQRRGVAELG